MIKAEIIAELNKIKVSPSNSSDLDSRDRAIEAAKKAVNIAAHIPCNVGDTVWTAFPHHTSITKQTVFKIEILSTIVWICFQNGWSVQPDDFGKTVFLSKKDAEAAWEKNNAKA